jgi:hypothetical protein
MPYRAWNKAPVDTKRRYFELIRQGVGGAGASRRVGVSLSCGSLWFIDAGSVTFIDKPISSRYLTQEDRIEIADGLAAGEPVWSSPACVDTLMCPGFRGVGGLESVSARWGLGLGLWSCGQPGGLSKGCGQLAVHSPSCPQVVSCRVVIRLVFDWCEHIQGAVASSGVVPDLDVVVDRGGEFDAGLPALAVQ